MSVILDTHIWVWWLTGDPALSAVERDSLDAQAERKKCYLPATCLWEVQMLHAKGRLLLPLPFVDWLALAADSRILTILPLDVKVVSALNQLPASFHGDPADRMIVATARTHALPLATRDARIRRSRVVKIWKAD